jgi:periplasmic divalent cation tolerance protein
VSHELIVFVTTPSSEEANRIAEAIVTQRLAACVNIVSAIQSIYRWEGKITRDQESLMIIKTTEERYTELERSVKELHTYSTPEIVALRIEAGSQQYLKWLRESVLEVSHSSEDHS